VVEADAVAAAEGNIDADAKAENASIPPGSKSRARP
jgi:hypothetical protein